MDTVKRIQALLNERSWSRYRLEQESGLSKSTINNFFSKRNSVPKIDTLEPIVHAFGMTLSQLFAGDEEPFPLTAEQRVLLDKWAVLNSNQRQAVLALLDTMVP